ncbi:MAG: hypothetical protein L0287_11065 [Anaerolineae bacterium]|nr:hypothetical protein [Anaerolineae bacterium]
MFHESRNWKWMVPASLIAVMIWLWEWMMEKGWETLAMVPIAVTAILFIAAVMNFALYLYEHYSDMYVTVQHARNSTPEVRMFEAARGMHPDAVQALLIHRRALWRIKYIPIKDVADWILDEAPTVHAGFVDFVLDHSNNSSVMPKGLLSEGSKQFDPEGIVLDRDQYDDFILLMQQKLMCTEALGNQPPKWLLPWNVDLVRHRFGLDGEQYVVEEMSDAMKAIQRAQAYVNSNGSSKAAINPIHVKALMGLEQTDEMKASQS